jgi:exopolysaccharide production protein ExoY
MRVEQPVASFPIVSQNISAEHRSWHLLGACERIAALVLLALAWPAILISAAVIWRLSGRAPFIAHRRVGWRGSVLWMLKLRTMWEPDSRPQVGRGWMGRGWIEFIADDAGPGLKRSRDARVPHAFARFCRRHSIDELPQLWHVVRGEMLLVGPRPITRRELGEYYGAEADEILRIKPGIAGLWQASGRNRLTYRERVSLDLEFVRHRSPGMYFRILLRTMSEVWTGAGAW